MSNECQITTICGSTRYKHLIEKYAAYLERSGNFIVFRSQFFSHADGITLTDDEIERANELHRFKIRTSNAIHVINPGGYIGDSTKDEIAYAIFNEKDIYFMSAAGDTHNVIQDVVNKTPAKIWARYKHYVDDIPGALFPYAYCANNAQPLFT